ncbi:DEAD/DEAH box helicase [Candidatus Woesearchaeota archaeon]|nr:DEAD/DEAH box helicase [Candidatus Woesearchaeota archaeon]
MIKGFTPRLYQETILATAVKRNTLIVLPTGLGKTNIFLMIAASRLKQFPDSRILLIGPTKPLIDQYFQVFLKHFEVDEGSMCILTGLVAPEKRQHLWNSSKIVFSTPQGLENDIISNKINLKDVSLIGFDEAHRATGDYSYVWIAKKYSNAASFPRIVGMTASPGSDAEKIAEVCSNLLIEDIEVRTESDDDVKPYIQEIQTEYIKVDLPPQFLDVQKSLQLCIKSKLDEGRKFGYIRAPFGLNKSELLKIQAALHMRMGQGNRDFTLLKSVSLLAEIMKASHALELLETQGIAPLRKYMQKLQEEGRTSKVKALRNLLADANFKDAIIRADKLYGEGVEHPKLDALKKLVAENAGSKIIVFSQYRDSAVKIKEEFGSIGITAEVFVGQAKKGETGLSQKEQKAMLDRFREGRFNVLVATSIGEEGLDIMKVDLVVFYEPIPSAIRSIQRRGRTGRQEKGRVVVLVTRNTRDEAFRWVAHHKEKRMHRILKNLKSKIKLNAAMPKSLEDYSADNLRIFADHREKGPIMRELSDMGIAVELKALPSGDYLCSSRVAVEVKAVEDFVNSIVDGRLLNQLRDLKRNFERPIVIIEGKQDIYSVRGVHPNAIRGMLATIAVDYGIPLLRTQDYAETAQLLLAVARREQEKKDDGIRLHSAKPLTLKEQQEYIISALPGIESTIAKSLLKQFKSVHSIITASADELKSADMVGDKKAADIRRVVDGSYEG